MTLLYGPDGKPINVTVRDVATAPAAPKAPTRQMRRRYLRTCALSAINQKHGPEPRRLRRAMAFTLAKRASFIEQVRRVSQAW